MLGNAAPPREPVKPIGANRDDSPRILIYNQSDMDFIISAG
jgi:hypothetical protein